MTRRKTSARRAAALAAACALAPTAAAADCTRARHDGLAYTVCTADAGRDDLRVFLNDPDGAPWGTFARLAEALRDDGKTLAFAMNAGMYHPDRRPVGLYVEDGALAMRLITSAGPGNFGMLPNGVFCVAEGRFAVIESRAFAESPAECRHATQSGPMLVIDGALHPRFLPDATSRFVRNGVGVSDDGQTAYLVISDRAMTFHQFARIFRDGLGLRDALYLDGNVSRLHAPALGRTGAGGRAMGPILGVVAPAATN